MTRVRKTCTRIPELIEERMTHRFNRRESLRWSVFEQRGDQINRLMGRFAEDLRKI